MNNNIMIDNGYEKENYKWTQTLNNIELIIPVNVNFSRKTLNVNIKNDYLDIRVHGEIIISDYLWSTIKIEESFWVIDGNKIVFSFEKMIRGWWKSFFKGQEEIDIEKIIPDNVSYGELDDDVKPMVSKMFVDMKQKRN
jgi:hypothetical protein